MAGKTLIVAALVVASATSAFATDLYVAPADPVMAAEPETDWGGFYVGVLGLGTLPVPPWAPGPPDVFDPMFGVAKVVGYNWDAGDFIVGAEGIVGYYPLQTDSSWGPNGDQVLLEGNARLGIEVGSNAMIYGLVGVGTLRVRPGSTSGSASPLNFWTAGIGGEVMFGEGWAGRAQYNYRGFAAPYTDWYSHNVAVGLVKYFNN